MIKSLSKIFKEYMNVITSKKFLLQQLQQAVLKTLSRSTSSQLNLVI